MGYKSFEEFHQEASGRRESAAARRQEPTASIPRRRSNGTSAMAIMAAQREADQRTFDPRFGDGTVVTARERTTWEKVQDAWERGKLNSIAYSLANWWEGSDAERFARMRGASEAQAKAARQRVSDKLRERRAVAAIRDEADPAKGVVENVVTFGAEAAAQALGDPTSILGPGPGKGVAGVAKMVAGNAAVGGAADLGAQGIDLYTGAQDEFDLRRASINTAASGLLPLGVVAGQKAFAKVAAVKFKPKPAPEAPEIKAPVADEVIEAPKVDGPDQLELDLQPPKAEEGALFAPEEIADPSVDIVALGKERAAKMTDDEVEAFMTRMENAELNGDLLDDPHYRSLLYADLGSLSREDFTRVVNAFEDVGEDLFVRSGSKTQSLKEIGLDAEEIVKRSFDVSELATKAEASLNLARDARAAKLFMIVSGQQIVNARTALMPLVRKGDSSARAALKDVILKNFPRYAEGRIIVSNVGRALGGLRGMDDLSKLDFDDLSGAVDAHKVQLAEVQAAVEGLEETLDTLDDDALGSLIDRIDSEESLEDVLNVLTDPEYAQQYSVFQRTLGSFSSAMKSNAMSPITGAVNAASVVIMDAFRNGAQMRAVERSYRRAGRVDEAFALQLERQVGRSVYWQAHMAGVKAFMDRLKLNTWTDIERIVGTFAGENRLTLKARLKAQELRDMGVRSFDVVQKKGAKETASSLELRYQARLNVTDVTGFNAPAASRGGGIGTLVNIADRLRAGTANTFDALSTGSGKLFSALVDDWGRGFETYKTHRTLTARYLANKGMSEGLVGQELADFVTSNFERMLAIPKKEILDSIAAAVEKGEAPDPDMDFLFGLDKQAHKEANIVTFMDGPQTKLGQKSADLLSLDPGIVFPYVRTPIRLLEVGLVDSSFLGQWASHNQKILQKGGLQADLLKAQMQIGTMVSGLGFALGAAGVIQVTNGQAGSTSSLGDAMPGYIKIGDARIEFKRLDPFALTLAVGAVFGQAALWGIEDAEAFETREGWRTATAVMLWGAQDAILSKSYLTGLRDLVALMTQPDRAESIAAKLQGSVVSRLIPLSGSIRQSQDTIRGYTPQTADLMDEVWRSTPILGMSLPPKHDLMGDPIDSSVFGLQVGMVEELSPAKQELKDLRITLRDYRKTDPAGFRLTAEQYSEFLRIRGKEALNEYGQTLEEALQDLFISEDYSILQAKEAKRQMVMEVIREFNKPAKEILAERFPDYDLNKRAYAMKDDLLEEGYSEAEAELEVESELADYINETGEEPF